MNASSSQSHCLLPETEQKARRETVLHDSLAAALEIGELEDGILAAVSRHGCVVSQAGRLYLLRASLLPVSCLRGDTRARFRNDYPDCPRSRNSN